MDRLARLPLVAVLLLSAAACQDGDPVAPPHPPTPANLAHLHCRVTVASGELACTTPAPGTGQAQGMIVGGQGTNVFLEATNHSYDAGIDRFAIDVTVQNLIPQALGTTDGTTTDADAVRIFFEQEPIASDGSGLAVSVLNHHGTDFFLSADQKYFKYDQVLQPDETSDEVNWQFTVADGLESFSFTVYVAAEVQFPNGWVDVSPAADTMPAGDTQALTATVRDALGNELAGEVVTWGTSAAGTATVDGAGVVTGVAPGTATITATNGPRSGTAAIAVCPDLALGEVHVADMPAGSSLCLAEGEYTVVPVNTSGAASVALGVTGAGIVAATEPPLPALLPGGVRLTVAPGPRRDHAFEHRLRQLSRRELAGRDPNAGRRGGAGPRLAITPGVPAVGALMDLNVETADACTTFDTRVGEVMAVGTHVIVMEDTANPSGGLSASDYAAIADSFDAKIHPTISGAFGEPSDRDGNGRVIAFYTRAVNELTPPGSFSFIGGFFFARDLYSAASCATSNVGEMFYMLAADPAGEVGNVRSVTFIIENTLGTLAHEFEHLINASRRMLVNTPWNGLFEETWMDEGLAHVAEELMFYHVTGLSPGANLDATDVGTVPAVEDAFFKYAEDNYGRLRQWLISPHTNGPFQDDSDLATRGAIWAFLRYSADRLGGDQSALWDGLVNTGNVGLENLEAELGTDPLPWFRDFAAATYADDVGGTTPAEYTQPSWNFRDVYESLDYTPGPDCSCIYPLVPVDPANAVEEAFTLANGGATAFLRMGVPSGAFAGLTVLSGGVAPPGTVRLAVIRRK